MEKSIKRWMVYSGVLLIASFNVMADSAKGLEIAEEVAQRDSGFGSYSVSGDMTLFDSSGTQSHNKFQMHTLEVEEKGDKRAVIFNEPKNLKGMVSLTYSHGLKPDDQWIYLPAIKREKRLASRDKTGAFVGSEFSFEDISTFEIEKYTYEYINEESCGEFECYVIDYFPQYEFSGYAKLRQWIDKEIYQPRKTVYFDKQGKQLKTLKLNGYENYGNYWRPDEIKMTNDQSGSYSLIRWLDYQFGVDISESDMSVSRIKRWSK